MRTCTMSIVKLKKGEVYSLDQRKIVKESSIKFGKKKTRKWERYRKTLPVPSHLSMGAATIMIAGSKVKVYCHGELVATGTTKQTKGVPERLAWMLRNRPEFKFSAPDEEE